MSYFFIIMMMSYNRIFKSLILVSLLCFQAQSSAETALKVNGTEQAVAMATTSTNINGALVSDLDKINAEVTANSASSVVAKTNNKKASQSVTHFLPSLPVQLEKDNSALDNANIKKADSDNTVSDNSNKTKIKCSSDLPCIPMYNKYVLNLDEDPQKVSTAKNGKKSDHDNDPQLSSKNYHAITQNVLPSLDFLNLQKSASNQNVSFVKKLNEKNTPIVRKPSYQTAGNNSAENYVSSSPLVAKMLDKGLIIGGDVPVIPQTKLPTADELKNKSTDELIDESQKLYKIIGVTGNFVRSYSEAEDKKEFIQNLGISKVNGIVDSHLNEYLKAYEGVNAEISTRLSVSKGNWKLQPEGKLLVPLWSKPKSFTYMQTGLTTGTSDRKIAHLGIGERIYPQAKSMENLGHHMLGFNAVVDKDLSRGHTRGSIGLEYMHDNLKLVSNIYRRLSSWKDSPDFEKGYVQERPASGWDFFAEFWFKAKLALKAGVTHWIGRDISPFGDTNEKNLENDPYIYEAGIKYTPVPAISLEAKHQHTNHGNNNSYIGINFNIPLGDNFSFENAFNPDAVNKAQGNNIMTSRSMFIERDYTMPLQYRSKPGMYYITFMGALGNNRYQFKIEDGFKRAAPNLPVYVKAKHPSVKLSNNGNYITNIAGMFVVEVTHSAVRNTTLTVIAGSVANDFNITIDKVDLLIKASKTKFERFEESLITLYADADVDGLEGTKVSFRIADGAPGSLVDAEHTLNAAGQATVIYRPDETKTSNYDVKVIGTVFDIDFPITLHVVIYGNDADSFSVAPKVIDGGQYATITYTNLKPHSILTVSATGKCKLTDTKPEKALETKATGDTPVKLELEADDEGSVVAYAVGATDIGSTGSCLIETKTQDPYFPAPKAEIQNQVYDPAWELPASVLYLEAFPAKLKNLKNTTEVDFSIGNDSADLEFSKTVKNLEKQQAQPGVALMRLAVSPNNSGAVKKVTVENKQASADYMVTGDYSVRDVEGIKAVYYHDAFNTQAETTASVLAIQQFTPVFVMNDEELAKLDVFSGNDEVSATLINGQPNRAVQFFNDEQNVDLTVPDTFDAAGQAKITIKGTDKRANEPFSIKGLALGKTVDLKDAIGSSHTLQYHIYKPALIDSAVSGGVNVKSELVGVRYDHSLPKLDDSDATLDYGTEYTFNVNNLLPNSKLAVEATNGAKVSLKSEQANDKGEAAFVLHDITDTSVKELAITLKYHQTSSEKAILDEVYNLKLFNYSSTLKLELDKAQIVNNDEVHGVLSGGKPGEEIAWSVSGATEIVSSDAKFDEQGNAKVTVKGNPVDHDGVADVQDAGVTATTMSLAPISKAFKVALTQYHAEFKQGPKYSYLSKDVTQVSTNPDEVVLDYKTEYPEQVVISGMLPNSKVEVATSTNDLVSPVTGNTDANGDAVFKVAPVNDLSLDSISFKVKYYSTEVGTKVSDNFTLKMYKYVLSIAPKSDLKIVGYNSDVVTVSGGKPGEEIAWSVSGATEIVSSDAKFDEQGNAKVTVKGNPVDHDGVADVQDAGVTATTMSLAPISKAFKVALTQYHAEFKQGPKSSYPNYPLTNTGLTSTIDDVTLDYKTAYSSAQLQLQNVLPNSKVEVISSTNDLVSLVGNGADANGVIKFNIAPNNDFSLKQLKFKIKYYATEAGTKESDVFTLNMIPYNFKLTASPDKSTLTGYEKVTMTLSGGKPGEEVTWKNNQKIVIVSQENNSKFDNNGNSIIVIAGAPSENDGNPVSETGSIAAVAMGQNELRKEFSVVTNGYTMSVQSAPSFSYPNTVSSTSNLDVAEIDYKRTYNSGVVLTGMAANRPVQIVDVQAVSNNRAANNSSDLVVATTRKTTASGDLALNIKPVSDYNVKKIRFRVRYPSTETGFKTSDYITIPLHQYSLAIASDKSEIVGNGASSVTVSGGKPGEAVSVAINNKLLGTVPTKFDNSGNATFTVTGNPTNNGQAVTETGTITAQATSATNSSSKSITVKTNQFYCNFSQGPSFAYPATVATTTTEASAQMDYKRTYTNGLVLKDMAPNRPISIASQQLIKADNSRVNWNGVSLASATTAADKTAKLNLAQVTDYQYKKVAVKVNYPSTEIGTLTSKEFIIPLHQYSLAIASDKSEIVGDETAKITVSGGRPGETVSWSNTGSGTILSAGKSTTFDAQGNAYATVQGTAPFTGTINCFLTVFNKIIKTDLSVNRISSLHFSTGYYSNQCNFNIAKTYNFDLSPYYNAGLIKSFNIVFNADDHGYVSINGETYIRTTGKDYDTHHATVPETNIKPINSITIWAEEYWSYPRCSYDNQTGAHATIIINYK